MRILALMLVLFGLSTVSCTVMGLSVVGDQVIEKVKRQENPVTREYPRPHHELWRITLDFCEEQFEVRSSSEKLRSIETEWVAEEYRPEDTPPDFLSRMKKYGAPLSPSEVKWCGIRHRFLVFIVPLRGERSRIEVQARIKGYNYGYRMWRWWNSKGTLERAFLANLEKEMQGTRPER